MYLQWVIDGWDFIRGTKNKHAESNIAVFIFLNSRQHMDADAEQIVTEWSCGLRCAEIQDCSVINGWGRAPLIVVPDTGTRPQTKQDRAGAGCHAQSPSSRKPECCSGGLGGKRGHWWWQQRRAQQRGEYLTNCGEDREGSRFGNTAVTGI